MTDATGSVAFQNLPIGRYLVEIEGNAEYLPTSKIVSLINEEENDVVTVFVGLKPRIDTDVEF